MRIVAELRSFLRFLLRRRTVESQMDEEIEAHIALRAEQLVKRGVPRADAERQARGEVGSAGALKEDMRDAVPAAMSIDTWAKDVGYAFRRMRDAPAHRPSPRRRSPSASAARRNLHRRKTMLLDRLRTRSRSGWCSSGPRAPHRAPRAPSSARSSPRFAVAPSASPTSAASGRLAAPSPATASPSRSGRRRDGRLLRPRARPSWATLQADEGLGEPASCSSRTVSGGAASAAIRRRRRVVRWSGTPARVVGVMPPSFAWCFPPGAGARHHPGLDTLRHRRPPAPRPLLPAFRRAYSRRHRRAAAEITAIGGKLRADVLTGTRERLRRHAAVAMTATRFQEIRPVAAPLFARSATSSFMRLVDVANILLARGDEQRRELACAHPRRPRAGG